MAIELTKTQQNELYHVLYSQLIETAIQMDINLPIDLAEKLLNNVLEALNGFEQ